MSKSRKKRPYASSMQMMMPWHPGATVGCARAAEMLGTSEATIVRMIEDGTLEAFKRRRRTSPWVIIRESVLRTADEWRRQVNGTNIFRD